MQPICIHSPKGIFPNNLQCVYSIYHDLCEVKIDLFGSCLIDIIDRAFKLPLVPSAHTFFSAPFTSALISSPEHNRCPSRGQSAWGRGAEGAAGPNAGHTTSRSPSGNLCPSSEPWIPLKRIYIQ